MRSISYILSSCKGDGYYMASAEITFSTYAGLFYDIIEGGKGHKAKFVKMLLKMGQSENGVVIIEKLFPEVITSKGNKIIIKSEADRLRKYLLSDSGNGISIIASDLEANFDKKLYIEELEQYETSRLQEFAKSLKLDTNLKNIKVVRKAIAACYYSILETASTKQGAHSKRSKISSKSNEDDLICSYTFTDTEKKALRNVLDAIAVELHEVEHLTKTIDATQGKLTQHSTAMKRYYKDEIELLVNRFNEAYNRIEKLCANMVELLEPKKDMNKAFSNLISIASNIRIGKYKCMEPDEYNYMDFWIMIYEFKRKITDALRVVEKL